MRTVFLPLAVVCSILLAALTVAPPPVPTDWARLDAAGVYVPQTVTFPWPSYVVQVGLWLGIVVGVWVGGRQGRFAETPGYAKKAVSPRKGLKILPVIVPIVLGVGVRGHTLDDLPLIVDEIGFAAHASDILHGQHVPIFAPGHNANPSVYSWLVSGAMALFGQNAFAIRLIPLLFGMVSIPAIYLLGRVWWSRRVGLAAAAFVATYPAHVFYSRMSLYNIVEPVFAMLALAALGRALRRGARRDYVLAGMMAACGQYFYHGSRLVVVLGLLAVGYWLLEKKGLCREAERQRRREILFGLMWMGITFAVMTLPRFAPMAAGGLPVEGNREALRLPEDFWPENTVRAALAWFGERDVSPFWLSGAPLLLPPALALFVVGLAVSALRWRDGRYAVLLATVVLTTIFGGAIWTAAPLYVRYMTAIPAIGLLVAVSFQLSAFSKTIWGRYAGIGIFAVVCVQGVVVSLWQHPVEARARITDGEWWMDNAARGAAWLGDNVPVVLEAPPEFGELERITLADYVAAYGMRRGVTVIERSAP